MARSKNTPAPEPKVESDEAEGQEVETVELSYPPERRTGSYEQMLFERWKEQDRVKCAHKACYYPLNILRPVAKNREPIVLDTPEGKAYQAECSWDPRHEHPEGGPQYVTIEKLNEIAEKHGNK